MLIQLPLKMISAWLFESLWMCSFGNRGSFTNLFWSCSDRILTFFLQQKYSSNGNCFYSIVLPSLLNFMFVWAIFVLFWPYWATYEVEIRLESILDTYLYIPATFLKISLLQRCKIKLVWVDGGWMAGWISWQYNQHSPQLKLEFGLVLSLAILAFWKQIFWPAQLKLMM